MSIESHDDLVGLQKAGQVVAEALAAMRDAVQPGMTTEQLDAVGGAVFLRHGARSGPQLAYGFPGVNCISIDDEAVHGVPSNRTIHRGDLVKIDVTAELDGYLADAAISVEVDTRTEERQRLIRAAAVALGRGLRAAHAGRPVNAIGSAVEREVRRRGYSVIPELGGHGIGRRIHEPPSVPNFADPANRSMLTEGLVLTVEPIITAGSGVARGPLRDGWTLAAADRSLVAHVEHTIVVTRGRPLVLTRFAQAA